MTDHSITAAGALGPIPADDPARQLTLSKPDAAGAPRIFLAGDTYTILVSGDQTEGRYCLIDMHIPDGGGPPPHRHDFEEMFTLLDGELEFTFRGQTQRVAAPATLNIPANAPHQFKNVSGRLVHMLCLCSPAGQDEFFRAVGVPLTTPDAPPPQLSDDERAQKAKLAEALSAKYRTEMLHSD